MAVYKGFSTSNWLLTGSLKISDSAAVREDLSNHIFTRLGERAMMPGFGTRIPDLAFEPNDELTIKIIKDDILKVINYDPRVELIEFEVLPLPDNNAIIVIVTVFYIELDITEVIRIDVKNGKFI